MGLDCTAYKNVVFVEMAKYDDEGDLDIPWGLHDADGFRWSERHTATRVNHDFPGRADPIIDKAIYTFEARMGFRAGSYGGYYRFRSELARLGGYTCEDLWEERVNMDVPFALLVNFSDCEGIIGSIAATKLLAEFNEHDARAKDALDGYEYDRYREWVAALEMAAQNGFIDFH